MDISHDPKQETVSHMHSCAEYGSTPTGCSALIRILGSAVVGQSVEDAYRANVEET